MTTKCPSNSLASRRGVNLPELQFCLNYDSKNTPPQIQHNKNYLSFREISIYNWNNPPNKTITRRPDIEFFYKHHLSLLKLKNITIEDHLINKLFNNNEQYKLIINEFPYWVNDATHWLLWFNLNYNLNIKEKTEEIVNKYFPDKEVVMYENNESNKTIKEIRHTHIFVKN